MASERKTMTTSETGASRHRSLPAETSSPALRHVAVLGPLAYAAATTLALMGLVLLTACASGGTRVTPHDEALRQLYRQGGSLGWDGLRVGMTRAQVEQAMGRRLPPLGGPDELCERYYVHVTHLRQDLDLVFSGTTESARLLAMTLHLHGGFDRAEILPRLESRLGPLEFVPSRHQPNQGPAQIGKPLYRTAGGDLVFLDETGKIDFGDVCVD